MENISKLNCWEYNKCGREPGGINAAELGVCPAAIEKKLNGIHCGKNAGRACWIVAGTLCEGTIQGTYATKRKNCLKCDFYKLVKEEESPKFITSNILLEINERRMTAIMDNMTDCVITTDDKGLIESINSIGENMFCYSNQKIIDKKISILLPELYINANGFYLKDKNNSRISPNVIDNKFELTGMKKDKTIFPIEISINRIVLEAKIIFVVIISDITQRKKIDKMKNEFVSTVSHELRTPLTAICGSLGLLINSSIVDPNQVKSLIDITYKNGLRLVDLVNDILDIEKIEAGKMVFAFEPIEITSIVEYAIESNKHYAGQYNVKFKLKKILPNTKVYADKNRLIQVITNLLSNAAKFSPPDSEVLIFIHKEGELVRTSVTDYGCGIPEEFRDKIFEKFTQADSSDTRHKGGTGLGLSICKALIEKMSGNIDYKTKINEGTTFYFDLPEFNNRE
ncbi:MAG: hypothetical protein A2Y25_00555 [Candidatus Melainabacteria bacterium GWF2_37_15]|nr:MAG: hypothetical protein A2Y25_00555 [Candidatus Melainabacteria bacterium GWF2_37_15]